MPDLEINYGGLLYWDRTLPLYLGQVVPEGVKFDYHVHENAPALFEQQIQQQPYAVSEMSASSFLVLVGKGDDRFVGLPIYVSRNFRQGQVYVNANSGITHPSDLPGKRVGVLEYQMTAALWIRAFLQHDFGVLPEDLLWQTGGLTQPQWQERLPVALPTGVKLERIPEGETLEGMLERGTIDALVTAQPPKSFATQSGPIRRLFPDHETVERDYYQRTGLFPIMHLVVIRRDVYEANRWLPGVLLDAFNQAKAVGQRRLRAITGLAVGLPWLGPALDTVDEVFDGDAFPYGLNPNAVTLGAMADYAFEQGLTNRRVDLAELCAPELM